MSPSVIGVAVEVVIPCGPAYDYKVGRLGRGTHECQNQHPDRGFLACAGCASGDAEKIGCLMQAFGNGAGLNRRACASSRGNLLRRPIRSSAAGRTLPGRTPTANKCPVDSSCAAYAGDAMRVTGVPASGDHPFDRLGTECGGTTPATRMSSGADNPRPLSSRREIQ